jgi:tRNA threonylcarbamoyladenosine biosynthesis protein TsaE
MELIINNLEDLPQAVNWLLKQLNGRKKLMLYGQMGAGKTTFTRAFCQHFGVTTEVQSPTFSLVNQYFYKNTEGGVSTIYHLDLYRLKNLEEAFDIGIEDYLYDSNYCLIEWADLIESILPDDAVKIQLEIVGNTARKIVVLP